MRKENKAKGGKGLHFKPEKNIYYKKNENLIHKACHSEWSRCPEETRRGGIYTLIL